MKVNDETVTYTILGPFDVDTENNIISFQSQFAKAIWNHKVGDTIIFKDKKYTITEIKGYIE